MAADDVGFGLPLGIVVLLCGLAWVSGALCGYGLHELPRFLEAWGGPKIVKRRRKRTGYYFSEDQRSYRDRRWQKRLGWLSFAAVSSIVLISVTIVALTYKTRPNAAAAMRHLNH